MKNFYLTIDDNKELIISKNKRNVFIIGIWLETSL